jgi:hypothetical protein
MSTIKANEAAADSAEAVRTEVIRDVDFLLSNLSYEINKIKMLVDFLK